MELGSPTSTVNAPMRLPRCSCCRWVPSSAYMRTTSGSLPVKTWYVRSSTINSDAPHAEVLRLQPLVDAVLGALAADARLLDAAEGRHLGGDDAGVDAEDPVLERLRDAPDAAHVARVEVRGQAVWGVVGLAHRLLLGGEAADPRHRAEGLLAAHRHRVGDAGHHGRGEELRPELVPRAAEEQLGPAVARVADVALDLLDARRVDER